MVDRQRARRSPPPPPRIRWDRLAIFAGIVGLVFLGGWLLARALGDGTTQTQTVSPSAATYEVVEGTVGSTLRMVTHAAWSGSPIAANPANGVVTAVEVAPGALVRPGDIVYRVNQRPVVAASGTVPSFRDLVPGDTGADVTQLQQLLTALGLYEGEVDGEYGTGMAAAVVAWQQSLGLAGDGVVLRGDLLVLPELPARLASTDAIRPGAEVVGGEEAVELVADVPRFLVPLPSGEAGAIPWTADVLVDPDGMRWEATVTGLAEAPDGAAALVLSGTDGGAVCGEECGESVPVGPSTLFPVEVAVVPQTSGPLVPVEALLPDGDGWKVRLADGEEVPVEVLAASGGWAVVEGVQVGQEVELPPGGGPSLVDVVPAPASPTTETTSEG